MTDSIHNANITTPFFNRISRKIIVTGHYGSGKTEFTVSLAMLLARQSAGKLAVIDLDIVNPYFRSRERREMLEEAGVSVYGSLYKTEITAELPALGASARAPLEDKGCRVIVDAGGNDSGAIVLNQFAKYFTDANHHDTTVLAVVNANRPDTSTLAGAIEHIRSIETATALNVDMIVNNTHLLRETDASTIIAGEAFCNKVCDEIGKELLCSCYPENIVDPADLIGLSVDLMPLGLFMRPTWLDK